MIAPVATPVRVIAERGVMVDAAGCAEDWTCSGQNLRKRRVLKAFLLENDRAEIEVRITSRSIKPIPEAGSPSEASGYIGREHNETRSARAEMRRCQGGGLAQANYFAGVIFSTPRASS